LVLRGRTSLWLFSDFSDKGKGSFDCTIED
jgi:hypothetical protein